MAAGAPAGLASRPRGLLASASHSGRGLVPPRAPGRGQLSPPLSPPPPPRRRRRRPLPPDRALNHPSPLPQKPPHAARPRRARPRGCEPPAAPRVCVAASATSRPRTAQAARGAATRRAGATEDERPDGSSAPRTARQATGEQLLRRACPSPSALHPRQRRRKLRWRRREVASGTAPRRLL